MAQGMVINPVLMLRHYNDYVKNIDIVDNVKETKKAKKDNYYRNSSRWFNCRLGATTKVLKNITTILY